MARPVFVPRCGNDSGNQHRATDSRTSLRRELTLSPASLLTLTVDTQAPHATPSAHDAAADATDPRLERVDGWRNRSRAPLASIGSLPREGMGVQGGRDELRARSRERPGVRPVRERCQDAQTRQIVRPDGSALFSGGETTLGFAPARPSAAEVNRTNCPRSAVCAASEGLEEIRGAKPPRSRQAKACPTAGDSPKGECPSGVCTMVGRFRTTPRVVPCYPRST